MKIYFFFTLSISCASIIGMNNRHLSENEQLEIIELENIKTAMLNSIDDTDFSNQRDDEYDENMQAAIEASSRWLPQEKKSITTLSSNTQNARFLGDNAVYQKRTKKYMRNLALVSITAFFLQYSWKRGWLNWNPLKRQ